MSSWNSFHYRWLDSRIHSLNITFWIQKKTSQTLTFWHFIDLNIKWTYIEPPILKERQSTLEYRPDWPECTRVQSTLEYRPDWPECTRVFQWMLQWEWKRKSLLLQILLHVVVEVDTGRVLELVRHGLAGVLLLPPDSLRRRDNLPYLHMGPARP